jgi:hypothetical protein
MLCPVMGTAGMHVEVCSDMTSATRKLCRSKFEGVAIDFRERTQALEMLSKLHNMTSHRGAVVLAILDRNEDIPSTFRSGANFILERPFVSRLLVATLRASYSLMLQERRRYFRCTVEIPVHVSIPGSNEEFLATSANVSERGIALNTQFPLRVSGKLHLRMGLPGTRESATMIGEVCWSNGNGRAGIHFIRVSPDVTELLRSWLFDRLQESLSEPMLATS